MRTEQLRSYEVELEDVDGTFLGYKLVTAYDELDADTAAHELYPGLQVAGIYLLDEEPAA